jgi:hypothetical protein
MGTSNNCPLRGQAPGAARKCLPILGTGTRALGEIISFVIKSVSQNSDFQNRPYCIKRNKIKQNFTPVFIFVISRKALPAGLN